jgi:trimethylamine--corrinoid protein Co-methyltransferase
MFHRYAEILAPEALPRVHDASLEILAEVGLLVRNRKARERLLAHGCRKGKESEILHFPRGVVEEFRAMIPAHFTLHARDEDFSLRLPRDIPAFTTASSAPNVVDPTSGEERRSTSDDIARIAHMVNELPGFDVFSISVLANDHPPDQFSLSRFYPALKNCRKPVRTSVIDVREAEQVLKLGALIAGSEEAFLARPFITFGYCAIVSPLTMDYDSTEMLMFFAERGLPAYGTIAPIGGLSTPLSLPAMLAQMNAEWLAAAVLAQMSRPGTPLLYNHLPVFADMRDGAYAAGAVETGIMNAAVCQMGCFYGLPTGGYLGLTNAKISDAQAGYEKAMSPLIGLLSGVDYIVMGGLLDALMTLDYGQLVIDNEIALNLKTLAKGMAFSEESLALQEIKDVGPGGMFAGHANTLAHMHEATFLSDLADRKPRATWEEEGRKSIHDRAMERVRAILTRPNRHALAPEIDARVRAGLPGLVAGESRAPEGWTPPKAKRRARRENARRRASA